jgi:hypothetical protein
MNIDENNFNKLILQNNINIIKKEKKKIYLDELKTLESEIKDLEEKNLILINDDKDCEICNHCFSNNEILIKKNIIMQEYNYNRITINFLKKRLFAIKIKIFDYL